MSLSHSCKFFLTDSPHLVDTYNEPSTVLPFAIRTGWEYLSQVPINFSQRESCEAAEKEGLWIKENGKARLIFDLVCWLNDPNAPSFLYPILSPWNQQITSLLSRLRDMIYSSQWNLRSGVTDHREAPGVSTSVLFPAVKIFCSKNAAGWDRRDGTKPPTLPSWMHLRPAPSNEFPSIVSELSQ